MSFGAPYLTLPSFKYVKPKTLREALEFLAEHGEDAKIMAGGVAVIDFLKERLTEADYIVDIKGIEELGGIRYEENKGLTMGSTITLYSLRESRIIREKYSALHEALKTLDPILIHRATIGGNICEAFPWMDTVPPLLVFDAELNIISLKGKRKVKLKDFIKGTAEIDLNPDEILESIFVPEPPVNSKSKYVKVLAKSEFGVVNIAGLVSNPVDPSKRIVKLAYGAASPTPTLVPQVEEIFRREAPLNKLIEEATSVVLETVSPMTDIHASEEYRRYLIDVLTRKILFELLTAD